MFQTMGFALFCTRFSHVFPRFPRSTMVHHGPPMQLLFFVQHLQSLLQQTQGAGEPQKSLPLHSHENVGRWKLTFQVAKSICAQIRTNSYTMLHHEKETEILKV